MTSVALVAALSLVLGDEPKKKLDIKLDKVTAPDLSMPNLGTGSVPKAEGL